MEGQVVIVGVIGIVVICVLRAAWADRSSKVNILMETISKLEKERAKDFKIVEFANKEIEEYKQKKKLMEEEGIRELNADRQKHREFCEKEIAEHNQRKKELSEEKKKLREKIENGISSAMTDLDRQLILGRISSYKWTAGMIADMMVIFEQQYINALSSTHSKVNQERAVKINSLKKEKRRLIEETKILKYELEYIRTLIPETDDIIEFDELGGELEVEDYSRKILSREDYLKLTDAEKNELALEYYFKRKKSNWEIGRDFERFVGYLYEKGGFSVRYFGIEMKFNDLGRDLIAENKEVIHIVQCKYWKRKDKEGKKRVIHEKHIAQLYGTVVKYRLDQQKENKKRSQKPVCGVFVTHTELSDEAKRFADTLGIIVQENVDIGQYPIIKCNVNNKDGETTRIYHLPMDQQYDTTTINHDLGDFYAMTIEEAESKGFRRAFRWHSKK